MEMKKEGQIRAPLTDITFEPWVGQRSGNPQQRTSALGLIEATNTVLQMEHQFQRITLNPQPGFQTPLPMPEVLKEELPHACLAFLPFVFTSLNKSNYHKY